MYVVLPVGEGNAGVAAHLKVDVLCVEVLHGDVGTQRAAAEAVGDAQLVAEGESLGVLSGHMGVVAAQGEGDSILCLFAHGPCALCGKTMLGDAERAAAVERFAVPHAACDGEEDGRAPCPPTCVALPEEFAPRLEVAQRACFRPLGVDGGAEMFVLDGNHGDTDLFTVFAKVGRKHQIDPGGT